MAHGPTHAVCSFRPDPVTVDYSVLDNGAGGVATTGTDYEATSGTVTFAPGETTQTVSVTVLGDTTDELPLYLGEWILVPFSNVTGAELDVSFWGLGIGIIADDDPTPTITPGGAGVVEGDSGDVTVQVPVTLSNPSSQTITVDFTTLDTGAVGIATTGVDYVATSGTVTFAPGETTKTVSITVHGDLIGEVPLLWGEWILVAFSNPSDTAVLDTSFWGLGIGVVVDDD